MPKQLIVPSVSFSFQSPVTLRDRLKLKHHLIGMFKREKTRLESLSYIFCSDEFLLGINRDFLHHDYYTDIITFDLAQAGSPVMGEIYISVDRVRDNALNLQQTINQELHRVIFHGALHLCGYKDKSRTDIAAMRGAEDRNLRSYFR